MESFDLDGYETVWYKFKYFTKRSADFITKQLMDFKADYKAQVAAFSEISAIEIEKTGIEFDYIIRALGSNETTATRPNRVRSLCIAIHEGSGGTYSPLSVAKKRKTKSLKYLSRPERIAELEDVYYLTKGIDWNSLNILVVDDITTTGTTLEVIGKLIKDECPDAKLYGYCLAQTKKPEYAGVSNNEKDVEEYYRSVLSKYK
ncbi:ComF family protein [Paraflavitalea pollutisoli]|uniref:ComF family protein n=1 Tax=Paraflavitalea pollutisoli TaxID=3034143 RepID=UPI0023EB2B48|nr:hypothetical protein [Paraflavitalea sp. H1-2-19X]